MNTHQYKTIISMLLDLIILGISIIILIILSCALIMFKLNQGNLLYLIIPIICCVILTLPIIEQIKKYMKEL